MAYLQLRGIEKFFGEHRAIKGIDLTINQGEFIVFVGPSGCGKSTLLRLIAGLEGIDGGTLMLDGRDITDQPSSKRDLAMVFQSYALYPHMSVYENMSFALKLAKVDKQVIDEKVQNAARILNLTEYLQRTPKELSGGQRQRVAIARVMLKDAPVLLLDEATSALDSEVEAAIQESLQELMKGKTVIAIAHRLSTIAALDRLIVLDAGRVVEEGTHAQLLARGGIYAGLWARQSGGFLGEQGEDGGV